MSEATAQADVLIQTVTNQRHERPTGRRVLQDGTLQRTADTNPPPAVDALLERDRALDWQTERTLSAHDIETIKRLVSESGFFSLEPRLLINYCKEDPGTAIWAVSIDGHQARVVVYDPKPRRSAELDTLLAQLMPIWG